jgi:hypothetical protein
MRRQKCVEGVVARRRLQQVDRQTAQVSGRRTHRAGTRLVAVLTLECDLAEILDIGETQRLPSLERAVELFTTQVTRPTFL